MSDPRDKAARLAVLMPMFAAGRVYIPDGASKFYVDGSGRQAPLVDVGPAVTVQTQGNVTTIGYSGATFDATSGRRHLRVVK